MNNFASWSVILVFAVYFVYGGEELPNISENAEYKVFYYNEPFIQNISVQHLPEFKGVLGAKTWKNDTLVFQADQGCYQLYSRDGQKKRLCSIQFSENCFPVEFDFSGKNEYKKQKCEYEDEPCNTLNAGNLYLIIKCDPTVSITSIIDISDNIPDRE